MTAQWGILRPDELPSSRRLQSLGLNRAIRHFNDSAVPGMGGVWFTMPLVWSMFGIEIANESSKRPIDVANAIEARAMIGEIGVASNDLRVRGSRKLAGIAEHDWTYLRLSRRNTYVTQPYRQTCVQPLIELGLVKPGASRFNAFELSSDGKRLLALFQKEYDAAKRWVTGDGEKFPDAISARATPPPAFLEDLRNRVFRTGAAGERRRAIRDLPAGYSSEGILAGEDFGLAADHASNIRGGIAVVRLRTAAIEVLRAVEKELLSRRDNAQPLALSPDDAETESAIASRLRNCVALADVLGPQIRQAGEKDSMEFLAVCRSRDGLLERLAERDGAVIALRDGQLVPGPAFGAEDPTIAETGDSVPELPRIGRLRAFSEELEGRPNPLVPDQASKDTI